MRGRRLLAAWVARLVAAATALALFVVCLPAYYEHFRALSVVPDTAQPLLSSFEYAGLRELPQRLSVSTSFP